LRDIVLGYLFQDLLSCDFWFSFSPANYCYCDLNTGTGHIRVFSRPSPPLANRSRVIVLSFCISRIRWNADNSSAGQEMPCFSVVRMIITAVCVNRRFAYIVKHVTYQKGSKGAVEVRGPE